MLTCFLNLLGVILSSTPCIIWHWIACHQEWPVSDLVCVAVLRFWQARDFPAMKSCIYLYQRGKYLQEVVWVSDLFIIHIPAIYRRKWDTNANYKYHRNINTKTTKKNEEWRALGQGRDSFWVIILNPPQLIHQKTSKTEFPCRLRINGESFYCIL